MKSKENQMKRFWRLKAMIVLALLLPVSGALMAQENDPETINGYSKQIQVSLTEGCITFTDAGVWVHSLTQNYSLGRQVFPTSEHPLSEYHETLFIITGGGNNNPITTTSGGTVNIVDNADVEGVISSWQSRAANAGWTATGNYIDVSANGRINICLDNVYSTYHRNYNDNSDRHAGLGYVFQNPGSYMNVYLKGDNRVGNVFYCSGGMEGGLTSNIDNVHIIFRSATGENGGTSGTLTAADFVPSESRNHWSSAIGGNDVYQDALGIEIWGGTIWAGTTFDDCCTAIGAGGNGVASVTIKGGIVTAVSSSTGTAIGGGIGYTGRGGPAEVEITGGKVYAYNKGFYDPEYSYNNNNWTFVPAVAIGGGSSFYEGADPSTIRILGGEVHAQSFGGVAIGGGGSALSYGGNATIVISSDAKVYAHSIGGTLDGHIVNASTAIGGGTAGPGGIDSDNKNGGFAHIEISGDSTVINTTSIGGGSCLNSDGNGGATEISITGGKITVDENIGGGSVTGSGDGGEATITLSHGSLTSGTIGGGNAITGNGGAATITVSGDGKLSCTTVGGGEVTGNTLTQAGGEAIITVKGNGEMRATGIGGGDGASGHGGYASIIVEDNGYLYADGIGGGDATTGNAGDASIYITGGTLDCVSIGGGDATDNAGTPGAVFNRDNSSLSGIHIVGNNTISLTTGYIGGGTSPDGTKIGRATVFIDAPQATIQGQFIMSNPQSNSTNYCSFTLNNGLIDNAGLDQGRYVRAKDNGGALYLDDRNGKVTINGGVIMNSSGKQGGAIFMSAGTFAMTGGSIQNNEATVSDGGGVYIGGGKVNITGGVIMGNQALNGKGGGVYAGNGTILVDGGIIGTDGSKAGTGNSAAYGGGLYVVEDGAMTFSEGTIGDNYASVAGGGIYIEGNATLNLQNEVTLTGNHVPADGQGGGIYLGGSLNVGGGTGTQSMKCADNYAGMEYSLNTRNNVYLPANVNYINLASNISGGNTRIGITVNDVGEHVYPVVHVDNQSNEPWLSSLMHQGTLTGQVFDDRQSYIVIHVSSSDDQNFDSKFIYFIGCWTTRVKSNPETGSLTDPNNTHYYIEGQNTANETWHIKSNLGLAWFSSYVNGLNNCSAHRSVNAVMEADVDMGGYYWVPLGAISGYDQEDSSFEENVNTTFYSGNFDGQGHVITNLECGYLTGIRKYGLFGAVNGGTLKNILVDDFNFMMTDGDVEYCTGGIVAAVNGNTTISNCEARGITTDRAHKVYSRSGGLVGQMSSPAKVHSCMAMPEFVIGTSSSYNVGGLVGVIYSGSLENSFSNPTFTNVPATDNDLRLGGLAGYNNGRIENCYVEQPGTITITDLGGWFVGYNDTSGRVNYCYVPENSSDIPYIKKGTLENVLTGHGTYSNTLRDADGKYRYGHCDQQITAPGNSYVATCNGAIDNQGNIYGLLAILNKWVENNSGQGYSTWTRTMASPVNDDLPILRYSGYVAAGSTDGVFVEYGANLNTFIGRFNGYTNGGDIYVYEAPGTITQGTDGNVRLYIPEHMGIQQADNITVYARVGVTFDNSDGSMLGNGPYDWHMFSSALTAAPLGITYNYTPTGVYGSALQDGDITVTGQGYLPSSPTDPTDPTSGMSFDAFDLYAYYEPDYHWINLKRRGNDHWHQDGSNAQIPYNGNYENETTMAPGKGYLVAVDAPTALMADGVLNTGTVRTPVSHSELQFEPWLEGYNLVGNPYQSYLNVDKFLSENGLSTCYILDADAAGYIAYTVNQSTIPDQSLWPYTLQNFNAPKVVHPHQGFFVYVPEGKDELEFNNGMRMAAAPDGVDAHFRGEAPQYPLVSIACTDGNGRNDFATVELDRPEAGGGKKAMGLHAGDASVWFHFDDADWQTAFTTPGITTAPLRFKAYEDGTFTLRWGTANADFSYLHLIDNITGMDIDCLTTDSYAFEGKTTDYTSRFKLVFEYTGVEEPEVPEPVEGPTSFAFQMGDEMVINGEGLLQVFDVNGRCLMSETLHGQQNTVGLPNVSAGVYVIRLTTDNQVRTQKMVIR